MLCALAANLPLTINFLSGGEGLSGAWAITGGFGAKFGFPWLTRGRSDRSDVEREEAGVGVGGADDRDVMEPPEIVRQSF